MVAAADMMEANGGGDKHGDGCEKEVKGQREAKFLNLGFFCFLFI